MLTMEAAASSLAAALRAGRPIVALTGAGISTESGVPTFRGPLGLWQGYRPEELATPQAFARHPEQVWQWYHWRRGIVVGAVPNAGHRALVALEEHCGLRHPGTEIFTLITQNVDGLHRRAGSRRLLEVHGTIRDSRCTRCGRAEPLADDASGLVYCSACGALARPAVVWFGESLPPTVWREARRRAATAALALVVGTSAVVHPAASLIELSAKAGARIIEINPEPSGLSTLAHYAIRKKAGEALPRLLAQAGIETPKEMNGSGTKPIRPLGF